MRKFVFAAVLVECSLLADPWDRTLPPRLAAPVTPMDDSGRSDGGGLTS